MTSRPSTAQVKTAIRELGGLPEQASPLFPFEARRILALIRDPAPVTRAILADEANPRDIRFGALYVLLVYLNQQERTEEYEQEARTQEAEFGMEPMFNTFRALVARGRGLSGQPDLMRTAVDFARRAAVDLPGNIGVQHLVATFIADYLDMEESTAATELIEEADRAISLVLVSPYGRRPHYFETRSRISALQGNYRAARAAIASAIAAEPVGAPDVYRRLARYQATRVRIDLLEERARSRLEQQQFRSELDRFRTQQVELLGLLAAVVAFVASAASIASQSAKAADGARLMCAMAGAVILVFTSFAYTNAQPTIRRLAPPAALGAALLLTAVLMGG